MDDERYGIDEIAHLGGVSRRTVRYYVQQGLIPAPLGVGRGKHYGPEHLARLQEDAAFRRDLGARGEKTVSEKWTRRAHVDRYLELIRELKET